MNLLLDTCAFLWFITGDRRFSENAKRLIVDQTPKVFLSSISVWEIAINHSLGKIALPGLPVPYLRLQRQHQGFLELGLSEKDVDTCRSSPLFTATPLTVCSFVKP